MYKRLIYDSALEWVPYVAFGVTTLVFVIFMARAVSLRRERADQLSRMPLDD